MKGNEEERGEEKRELSRGWPSNLRAPWFFVAVSGFIGAATHDTAWHLSWVLLLVFPVAAWLRRPRAPLRHAISAFLMAAVALLFGWQLRRSAEADLPEPVARSAVVPLCRCLVDEPLAEVPWGGSWRGVARCRWPGLRSAASFAVETDFPMSAGDWVEGVVLWERFATGPGFDERAWRRSGEVASMLTWEGRHVVGRGRVASRPDLPSPLPVRAALQAQLLTWFSADVAGLLLGLTTGDKSGLPRSWKAAFQAAGLSHLLAVSGYHVGLVGFLPLLLARHRRQSFRVLSLLGLAMIWGFVWLCGFPLSAVRSGCMATVWLLGAVSRQHVSGLQAWAVAGWSMLCATPVGSGSMGAQLSFLAVFGIFLGLGVWAQVSERLRTWPRRILGLCTVPVTAQITTSPLTLVTFGIMPTAFLPFNLIAGPLMTLLGASIGLLLLGHFGLGWSPTLLVEGMEMGISFCIQGLKWWADQPISVLDTAHTSRAGWWALTAGLMLLGVHVVAPEPLFKRTLRLAGCAGLVAVPWVFAAHLPEHGLKWTWVRSGEPVWAIGDSERVICFATDTVGMARCVSWAEGAGRNVHGEQFAIRVGRREAVWKWGETKSAVSWDGTGLGNVVLPDGTKLWWEAWSPGRSVEVEELGEGLVYIPLPFRNVRNGQNGIDPVVPS